MGICLRHIIIGLLNSSISYRNSQVKRCSFDGKQGNVLKCRKLTTTSSPIRIYAVHRMGCRSQLRKLAP